MYMGRAQAARLCAPAAPRAGSAVGAAPRRAAASRVIVPALGARHGCAASERVGRGMREFCCCTCGQASRAAGRQRHLFTWLHAARLGSSAAPAAACGARVWRFRGSSPQRRRPAGPPGCRRPTGRWPPAPRRSPPVPQGPTGPRPRWPPGPGCCCHQTCRRRKGPHQLGKLRATPVRWPER